MSQRKFRVLMSERCFRFKPDSLPSHAPQKPGVYEFVTFDAERRPQVLFVGLALEKTVYDCLSAHLQGHLEPTAAQLFGVSKDIYFDYVADADIDSLDDLKDIAGVFIGKHSPKFNVGAPPSSGKYAEVAVEETELLRALPTINAGLNALSFCLLVLGWRMIKQKRVEAHQACMLSAVASSTAFLALYLYYHYHVGSVRYEGPGRPVYLAILLSHTVLAGAVVPLVLRVLLLALREK